MATKTSDKLSLSDVAVSTVVKAIDKGECDAYLKFIFDRIVERKKVMGAKLPTQFDEADFNLLDSRVNELLRGEREATGVDPKSFTELIVEAPVAQKPPRKPRTTATTQYHGASKPLSKPDPNVPPFAGKVPSFTSAHGEELMVTIDNRMFKKSDLMGGYFDIIAGTAPYDTHLTIQVVGVGTKAVKALLARPVTHTALHHTINGKTLEYLYTNNDPFYLPHSVLLPYLA